MNSKSPSRAEWAVAAIFFLAATLLITWPLASLGNSAVLGGNWDEEGAFLWNYWMVKQWLFNGQPLLHNSMGYGPWGVYFFVHTHTFTYALIGSILSIGTGLPAAYNLITFMAFTIGGVTAWRLAKYLRIGMVGSLLAGFVFTFSVHRLSQVGHHNLISVELVPLGVFTTLKLLDYRGSKPPTLLLATLAGAFIYTVYASYYSGLFFLFAVLFTIAASPSSTWLLVKKFLNKPWALRLIVSIATILLLLAPIVYSWYLISVTWHDPPTTKDIPIFAGIEVDTLLVTSPRTTLGHFLNTARFRGYTLESEANLGIAALLTVIVAFFIPIRRKRRRLRNTILVAFLLCILFAIGSAVNWRGTETPVPGVYQLLQKLPLAGQVRVPGRMMILAALPWGLLVGFGVDACIRFAKRNRRFGKVCIVASPLLLGLLVVEHKMHWGDFKSTFDSSEVFPKRLLEKIADSPESGTVAIVPTDYHLLLSNLYQMTHQRPALTLFVARQDKEPNNVLSGRDKALPRGRFIQWEQPEKQLPPWLRDYPPGFVRNSMDTFDIKWVLISPDVDQIATIEYFHREIGVTWAERESDEEKSWFAIELDRSPPSDEIIIGEKGWSPLPAEMSQNYNGYHIVGDEMRLGVFFSEANASSDRLAYLKISGSGLPARITDGKLQEVQMFVNGDEIEKARQEILPGHNDYRIKIPSGARQAGWNIIRLEFPVDLTPANSMPGSDDHRRLSLFLGEMKIVFEDK